MELSIFAIVLSIIIGVVTNIMTPHISNLFGKMFTSIKVHNENKKQVFINTVQYLTENPHEEVIFTVNYVQSVLGIGLVLLFSLLMMFSSNNVAIIIGFVLSLDGYFYLMRLNNRRRVREELIKIKRANHPDINLD